MGMKERAFKERVGNYKLRKNYRPQFNRGRNIHAGIVLILFWFVCCDLGAVNGLVHILASDCF